MSTKFLLKIAILFLLTPSAFAQNNQRELTSYRDANGVIEINTNDGQYRIQFYSDSIAETSFIPLGEKFNPESQAVVLTPQATTVKISNLVDTLEVATSGINITINKVPFRIEYSYHGKQLISEKDGYIKDQRGETISFNLDRSEALYGGGARALGMDRRGYRLPLYNKAHYGYEEYSEQMNFSIPLVFSSKMYGIHFDNAPIGYLDLDSKGDNVLTYETISGRKTYQVIAGSTWEEIADNYTTLTGKQPLLPRWALGNFSSRFGYHSEKEARHIVNQFIAEKIPLDAIIFDLYWFGKEMKGTMGNLDFDPDNFPHPQRMITDFSRKGVKTVLITEPFILTSSKRWDEAVQKNVLVPDESGKPATYEFYFGQTGLIDVFNPKAREWFWDIYKHYIGLGVAGWWGDLGEPEVHPSDLRHSNGTADEVHNIYGHAWAKLIKEGYQKDFPGQRPFILMRAGFAGSQRFGMIPWSGDVNRTWGGLVSQPEIALQMGMQGMGYMHSDLGGFAGDNLDDELYVRWLQYGVFQPIFRPHAQEAVASEPVLREKNTKKLAKAAIELRYQLLPYNYTLAYENNQFGTPLMRPLFYEEPLNTQLFSVSDSYFWGHDFLVKPVLNSHVSELSVYFPMHSNWVDFYSEKMYSAGSTEKVAVQPNHIPVFVRAGAFIPMIDTIQTTDHYSTKDLKIHYYHDASVSHSTGKLYDDDGRTPNAVEKKAYALLNLTSQFSQKSVPGSGLARNELSIDISEKDGAYYLAIDRKIRFIIHNVSAKPKQVVYKNELKAGSVKYRWDNKKNTLTIPVVLIKKSAAQLIISLADH